MRFSPILRNELQQRFDRRGQTMPLDNVDPATPGDRAYMQQIRNAPMLSAEEEQELGRRWRDKQDAAAANRLVTSHLRLVAKIAHGHRGYGLPLGELISEGNIGLMQAVKRFDPDQGFRFATYAMWWIRAAMQEYALHSTSLVKMGTTAAQKRLFFNLRRVKSRMQITDDAELRPEEASEIARKLGVRVQDVVNMNRRLFGADHSLNAPIRADDEGEWQDRLVDEADTPEVAVAEHEEMSGRKALLPAALASLKPRERQVLLERRFRDEPTTLGELGQRFGVSRERVRQIETRALQKLRKAMVTEQARLQAARQAAVASQLASSQPG
jgi:RNA polymerase sigma-32 factor